jgi:hypothetical protein
VKAYIVWNEARNEGVIFTDCGRGDSTSAKQDANFVVTGDLVGGPSGNSAMGCCFRGIYEDEDLSLEEIELPG